MYDHYDGRDSLTMMILSEPHENPNNIGAKMNKF